MNPNTLAYIGFSLVKGLGPVRVRRLLDHFGTAGEAWNANPGDLVAAGLETRLIEALLLARRNGAVEKALAALDKVGGAVLTWDDSDYPARLLPVTGAPPALYILGQITPGDDWAIAVVGTRTASAYGRQVAAKFSADLAGAKVTVVSGLARGIDTEAHQQAINAGGRTIAVLGSGVDVIYPPENRNLARRIVDEGRGAIVSEYAPGTQPDAINFPPRNRIISGLSLGVLIVEAGLKSGALITQRYALEQDREVYVVPGNIFSRTSEGTNNLLKQGAKCVTRVEDILEDLKMGLVAEHVEAVMALPEDPTERRLVEILAREADPLHIDEIARAASIPIHVVSAALTMLELKGMVRQIGALQYVLVR